jgi:hypothetical protein
MFKVMLACCCLVIALATYGLTTTDWSPIIFTVADVGLVPDASGKWDIYSYDDKGSLRRALRSNHVNEDILSYTGSVLKTPFELEHEIFTIYERAGDFGPVIKVIGFKPDRSVTGVLVLPKDPCSLACIRLFNKMLSKEDHLPTSDVALLQRSLLYLSIVGQYTDLAEGSSVEPPKLKMNGNSYLVRLATKVPNKGIVSWEFKYDAKGTLKRVQNL